MDGEAPLGNGNGFHAQEKVYHRSVVERQELPQLSSTWVPAMSKPGHPPAAARLRPKGKLNLDDPMAGILPPRGGSLFGAGGGKGDFKLPTIRPSKQAPQKKASLGALPPMAPPSAARASPRTTKLLAPVADSPRRKQAASSWDEDETLVSQVLTGDDVVEFYARQGRESGSRFFYCLPADTGLKFRPYDLQVVDRKEAGSHYFTFSASGVVQINGGLQSEFTSLSDWMREKSIFSTLTRIKFFKYYLVYKVFRNWRQTVRKKLFNSVRSRLKKRLFLAKPTFCSSLMEIYAHIHEITEVRVISANPSHLYQLSEFADSQVEERTHRATPAMEAAVERAQGVLVKVCTEVTKLAKLYQESIRDEAELNDTIGVNLYQGPGVEKGRSMVSIKQEKIERAKTYRRVEQEAKMLGDFVRLADYMLVEAVVTRAVTSVADLLSLLQASHSGTDKSHKGVFLTTVSFAEEGTSFSPTEGQVLDVINTSVMEGLMTTMNAVPRLLYMRSFGNFFEGTKMVGLNPVGIIQETPFFNELRDSINRVVQSDFEEAREYVKEFEEHRVIYEFGRTWNEDDYSFIAQQHTVAQFKADMAQQSNWRNELERMKISKVVGVVMVDSRSMRNSLVPITLRTLDAIKLLVLNSARETTLKALANFQARCRALGDRPAGLDEFVAFQVMHHDMKEQQREAIVEKENVDEMYDILSFYSVKVPTQDEVKLDSLTESVQTYFEGMEAAKEYIEERQQNMISTLIKGLATLNDDLMQTQVNLHTAPSFVEPDMDPPTVVEELESVQESIAKMRTQGETFQRYQQLFKLPVEDLSNLVMTEKVCRERLAVWTTLATFQQNVVVWTEGSVKELEVESILAEVERNTMEAYKMGRQNKDDRVVLRLKDEIESFKQLLPLVEELANPALKDRHWEMIFDIVGASFNADPAFTFSVSDLMNLNIMDKLEDVQKVSTNASKEKSLENALDKMVVDWEGVEFHAKAYKDTGTYTLVGFDDIQMILDDQIVKIQSMRASPFIKPFEQRSGVWEDTLQTLQDMLDNWLTCQATWQYLEPIFGSEDIMKQMPEEGRKFMQVDSIWRDIMSKTAEAPGAIAIGADKRQLQMLEEANQMLDEIQKGLASYLEVKRIAFPRFFFLSNDEMLEILSETKDPTRVQPHLKKCFEGINTLEFLPNTDIAAIKSIEGEAVALKEIISPAKANGAVEKWLVELETGMVTCLQNVCQLGVASYAEQPREQWVLEQAGQVVLVVTAIYWTTDVTEALKKESAEQGSVRSVEQKCTDQLARIVDCVRGKLTKLNRATLSALVVMDVHARDTVQRLAEEGVSSETDFEWLSQLRMYYEEETVPVRMMNATIEYGYEYLGNSSRLVITPLTDRCYRTLMGAIHLNMGGAPEGPAGTGKTETTKDLAKALARQCVVFNCSDSLDYLTMAKFFKGLASSGAWACFDEFNRIDLEVLSVVAQQVLEVQLAVKAKVKTFVFEGSELPLRPTCNAFITMNPGYAGRSELPDNLKALFRTVAMMVPDYAMISEIILYSNGYLKARESAGKIVATYKLCSEQLSSQDHYDYGMRAVMAVLRAAGNLKRQFPDEDEFVLMLRSIIDVNLCKFLSQDVPLFNGIVSDLFPGVVLPEPDYDALRNAMRSQCTKRNLQPTDYFFTKAIQLHDMIIVRHGLMVVGLSFSGKTECIHVLAGAVTEMVENGIQGQMNNKVQIRTVNPKSVTMGQLYGETDKATQEWKDGVLAVVFRSLSADPSPDRKWCVLDGPVDAIWIENMNTVLDDNKKLCLPNSEIIQMSPTMNMIFEVADLAVASPATVSRCGMVYLEPHQLGWRPLLQSWVNTLRLDDKLKARVHELFEVFAPAGIRVLRRLVSELSPTSDSNVLRASMRLFTSLLDSLLGPVPQEGDETPPKPAPKADVLAEMVDSMWLFAFTWGLGGTCDGKGRATFDRLFREVVAGGTPEELVDYLPEADKRPVYRGKIMPDDDGALLHDFMLDVDAGKWVPWADTITADDRHIAPGSAFASIIVPTPDSARYTWLLDSSVRMDYPALFVGPTGTGKSVYINRYLTKLPKEKFTPIVIGFSARTTANMTQDQVDGRLDKRRKGIYGPPPGKTALVLVDDLNMPSLEKYGAQPPIEILRQFMDMRGWYARDNTFRAIVDLQFVCAMGPAGGGRNSVTQRYLRHFNVVGVTDVADSVLASIFGTILDWHLAEGSYSREVKGMSKSVMSATLDVYNKAMATLLPTPSKSHYTFNLRDFARVVQGVMLMPADVIPAGKEGAEAYTRLWVHETLRVFYDRLTDTKDMTWMLTQLKEIVPKHFSYEFDKLLSHMDQNEDGEVDVDDMRRCIFGDYMDPSAGDPDIDDAPPRKYIEVKETPALLGVMEEYLVDHNGMSKRPMNLAIFLFACEHISRICRVLKQPGGHLLLVGVGGSGRQSLTRLAAHVSRMAVTQVEISKTYGTNEWREDLKKLLKTAGAEGKDTIFLFSDTQIKDEGFVEDINNILNSGEVPNMFPTDEKMAIQELARAASAKEGLTLETPLELWSYFVQQCKAKCHIVLAFSPIGDAFRERLRQFPSLVNCCTIDWFHNWPTDALEAVADKFLRDVEVTSEEQRDAIKSLCKVFHQTVVDASARFKSELGRHNYVTPTSYLELISTFRTLLALKRGENNKAKSRYDIGLEKIATSAEQVAQMQAELEAKQPVLIKTVEEVEQLMTQVEKEKVEVVAPKKEIVQRDEAVAAEEAAKAKAVKDECEGILAEAIPVLNDAVSALSVLKPADINYVKGLKNPPATIKLVMEAVCVVLDVKPARVKDDSGKMVPDYWKPSMELLNKKEFLDTLKEYDKDNIPPRIIAVIRDKYITDENFTPEKAANASAAAEGLCKWVCAMDKYDRVAKLVAPKKEALKIAEASYEEVMVGLRAKQAELKGIIDKLGAMEEKLEQNKIKKAELEADVELCSVKLERAEKLIGGLGGERSRWTEVSNALASAYVNLTGDVLVASGLISYLGAFNIKYREEIVNEWLVACTESNIPRSEKFSLNTALGDAVKIREWLINGLPNDSFSIDNGIIIANARRWPLMIDPQGQANKWVRNSERQNNLQVIKLSGGGEYLRTLENAIQFGLPVLLENVGEELDPSLEPLLLKQIFKSGGVNCIRLGDSTIEYSSDFRFYITTKMRNPHYLPETSVKVTLVNFVIVIDGLSDQMLGIVVAKERPDLEEAKNELVVQGAANKKKLKEIEDQILEVLSASEGNILDDERAINIITDAKVLGNEIAIKQVEAEETEKSIDAARKAYAPCGAYVAVLFFCITDLANIDPMYQYSLPWFSNLFIGSIAHAEKSDDVPTRLANIQDHFTYSLYCNVCRSLFEKDKLLFAFNLAIRIEEAKGNVDNAQWLFLLTGGIGGGTEEPRPAEWITERAWAELSKAENGLPVFEGLVESFKSTPKEWKVLYDSSEPHKEILPKPFQDRLNTLQKLIIVRCLRPDKLVPAVQEYVGESMGERYVLPPVFNLGACYADSATNCPLIFVLSPGSDPTAALLQFAESKEMSNRLNAISLGQGQGPKAEALIKEAMSGGNWVVLQNCHLAPSWMPALDKICEEIDPEKTNPDFRLWMTSYPSPKFPVTILQNGVKMTNEPPKGLRANITRSYTLEPICSEEFFEGCSKPAEFKNLLFGLCFFHAVIQERRKFGPLGWNIPYGFDDGDLRISARQLRMFIDENDAVPLPALRYVTGECNYGGRVTDDKDRILLNTLLNVVYTEPMFTDPNYKLSSSGIYYPPTAGEVGIVQTYVGSLPITPAPEAFGLHENADITKDQNDTYLMCNSLLLMSQSGGGGSSGGGAEAATAAVVKEMIEQLPANFDIEAVQNKWPIMYEESMNTVIAQEMTRFNKLLSVIRSSLENIDLAIQGLIVMSSTMEEAYNSMAVNKVPDLWKGASYPTMMSLSSYFKDLLLRLGMLQTWYETGQPKVFWLSGFYFTQSFLTAALQNYARKHKIPIDAVSFEFQVMGTDHTEYTEQPEDGVYIYGMFLEGCGWDAEKKLLCESKPKVLVSPAPVFWLKPKLTAEISEPPVYNCPLYRTMERRGVLATTGHSTNFVMFVRTPSDQPSSHWVKRGVAMIASLAN